MRRLTMATIDRVPLPLNRLLRAHWTARRRERQAWYLALFAAVGRAPRGRPRRRARVRVTVRRRRRQDPDNAAGSVKPLLDALKNLGWIVDDSPRWIELVVTEETCRRGERPATELVLEELHGDRRPSERT